MIWHFSTSCFCYIQIWKKKNFKDKIWIPNSLGLSYAILIWFFSFMDAIHLLLKQKKRLPSNLFISPTADPHKLFSRTYLVSSPWKYHFNDIKNVQINWVWTELELKIRFWKFFPLKLTKKCYPVKKNHNLWYFVLSHWCLSNDLIVLLPLLDYNWHLTGFVHYQLKKNSWLFNDFVRFFHDRTDRSAVDFCKNTSPIGMQTIILASL
jgi:hypothetical protein